MNVTSYCLIMFHVCFFFLLLMCFNEGLINVSAEIGLLTQQLPHNQQHMQLEMKLPLYPDHEVRKYIVSISHDAKVLTLQILWYCQRYKVHIRISLSAPVQLCQLYGRSLFSFEVSEQRRSPFAFLFVPIRQ